MQFDVFLGHDGVVTEGSWAPITCEVKNDGPTFQGVIEVHSGMGGHLTRVDIELPTGTLKRVVIPFFCPSGGYNSWTIQLRNRRGTVLSEHQRVRPRHYALRGVPVLGALSRSATGTPQIQQTLIKNNNQMQPMAARILTQLLPENPLVLEGLSAIYLNSERAADLKPAQAEALVEWLRHGGHLIVGIEQPQDLEASPWLRDILPVRPKGSLGITNHTELHEWLTGVWPKDRSGAVRLRPQMVQPGRGRSYVKPEDSDDVVRPFEFLPEVGAFESAELRVATGEVRNGARVEVSARDVPLIVSGDFGLGRMSVLMFSPEREPARSWKHMPILWGRLIEVPGQWYVSSDFNRFGVWNVDNVVGAMLETLQARKLPLASLLLMLLGYIMVIGPADYVLLKRLGRPMLTWVTFPLYIAGFSVIIYVVGFRLRAGDLEYNELNVVDVLASEPGGFLKGRTYGSLYSPANRSYRFRSSSGRVLFRGEQGGQYRGGAEQEIAVTVRGEGFQAEAEVPVWTSQLFSSDWIVEGQSPLKLRAKGTLESFELACENRTGARISMACVVLNRVTNVGEVEKGGKRTFQVQPSSGVSLEAARKTNLPRIRGAIQGRQMAFARGGHYERLTDWMFMTELLSFHDGDVQESPYENFSPDTSMDLSRVMERQGYAVVFVSTEVPALSGMVADFKPERGRRMTIWRVILQIERSDGTF